MELHPLKIQEIFFYKKLQKLIDIAQKGKWPEGEKKIPKINGNGEKNEKKDQMW